MPANRQAAFHNAFLDPPHSPPHGRRTPHHPGGLLFPHCEPIRLTRAPHDDYALIAGYLTEVFMRGGIQLVTLVIPVLFLSSCSDSNSPGGNDTHPETTTTDVVADASVGLEILADAPTTDAMQDDGPPVLTTCPDNLWESRNAPCDGTFSCSSDPITCCEKEYHTLTCACAENGLFACWAVDPAECFGQCPPEACISQEDCPDGWTCGLLKPPGSDPVYVCLPPSNPNPA